MLRGESGELLPIAAIAIPHKCRAAVVDAQKCELRDDGVRSDALWRHECQMWGIDESEDEEEAGAPPARLLCDFDTSGLLTGPPNPYAAISLAATQNDPTLLADLSREQLAGFVEATAMAERPSELEQLSLALVLSVLCDAPES